MHAVRSFLFGSTVMAFSETYLGVTVAVLLFVVRFIHVFKRTLRVRKVDRPHK